MNIKQILLAMLAAPRIFFAKNTYPRKLHPIEIDLSKYKSDDYTKIIPELKRIDKELEKVKLNKKGMRWIHHEETVWFYGERLFNLPFKEFTARVDISHVGRFYRDSFSVDTQVVSSDELNRPTDQVVRVIALPQPNYAAFMGKGNLDVTKLERIEHSEDEKRVWMLTVDSPNGSAVCDDGYMSFRKIDETSTLVSFLACQNFPPPPLMAMLYLHRWKWLKNTLTEFAYATFCNKMMDNIQDCYHGRDFDVGRETQALSSELPD